MTIIQLPDTYNFSGTIRDIVVDATEKLDFTLSSNGVTIVSETYYPSSDNRITINLRDILEDIIEPVLYEVAETVIPQYTYQIGETTGSFYCIAGGIDAEVSVESYLQGNFLTWQPQTRVTLYHIPHYLRYVSVVESICKVKAFFSDGTSQVAVLKTFSAKSINTVNVTFGTIRGMFESQPTYFDVWVENLEGEMLTWIQRYMLTDFLTGVNDYFIFANSLGGFDTIRFSGDKEETNKLDSVNAVFDDETKEYDIDRTRSWKKYTGYITDERIRMWVLDFFNSPCRYHLTDSGLLKRIYISDHKLESTIGDAVGYEFTYVYSIQSRYINIARTTTPPLLEITDPKSEIFFLAPKLNQFELAKIESETDYLFPVQSPMAGKWLAISLKTILDFVSSKGLDVDALQIYLTDHKYATQDWVKEQNYLTSANMDDYVLKKTWDSVFELAEVNGRQVLKIKYDVIGNLGITAYGTGLDSGESFTGSLVDLVDVAVSGLKAGDILKYNGTHFVNVPISSIAGASSWEQISGKPDYFPTRWSDIQNAPESLPASDVYPWAKAASKPSYNWDEITDKPSSFTPVSHTHLWANITDRPTKLSQFQDDVVADNYVLKATWDSVFELAEINGKQVLKIKYDVVGNWGITAYGTGPDLGESFTGSLVDLVDVSVLGLKAGDILKYNGTHFVNVPIASIAGASSWEQISGKPEYFPTRWSDIQNAPESLPASDVYPWAKAASKPSYNWDEITDKPSVFTPALHTHVWANITDRPTKLSQFQDDVVAGKYLPLTGGILTGDLKITTPSVIRDENGNRIIGAIDVNNDGIIRNVFGNANRSVVIVTDTTPIKRRTPSSTYDIWDSSTFNPEQKLNKSVWDEAFEIKTVNGIRVISAKLDVLGQKDISAYADSADSGSAGGGLDYELLKNALTGTITPDGYPFSISSKFLGTIDKSYITCQIGDMYADSVHTHQWTDITDRPTSLPANGGNADTVDNLHAYDFAQATQTPYVDIDTINGRGITGIGETVQATAERHYPIQEAGALFYSRSANYSANQIYGTFSSNRWFVRGGGNGPSEKTPWAEIWTTKNFDPNDYLPLIGGKTITGDFSVSAGVKIKSNEANIIGRFVFGSVADYRTIVGAFDYDTLLISKSVLKRNTNGTEYTIYDSGNLTKLSQLQDDVVSGNYFKLSANRVTNLNDTPINSFFVSSLGPSYSPVSYATFVNGFCFATDNNSMYKKQLVYADDWYGRTQDGGTWSGWNKFWHSGNFLPNYKFDNFGVTLDSKNEVGNGYTLMEAGASFSGPFLKWGQPDWMFEFYSPNDISNVYLRNMFDGAWQNPVKLWHSGNLNPVTIDSDQIITGWKRFNPSARNGVFNTTGIIDNKDTYATPLSWTAKTTGSIWNIQQESDSITLIGIQGGKAIKFLSNSSLTQVIADFFAGTATKAQQDGNGNVIANSYLRLTGGTLTGLLTTKSINANGTVTADRFTGPLTAGYTGNGGQQGPGYIGTNSFGCLMMNTTINGDPTFKDWLICDAYGGSDVGGAIAIGVSRQNMNVFAMSSDADRKTWTRKCQLYTTENANRNSVDWTARNITAAGSVTAPTFVGKLSGASSLLNINNDAGQSSVLQFMQMSTQNEANDLPSNTWHHVLKMNHGNGDTYFSRSLAFSFFDNGIYTRYRSNGTAHEWVALYGGHNANRSDVDWTARNINASETGTFKRLVINGIVIEVVNGNLRINGNLVATGGVTSQATA